MNSSTKYTWENKSTYVDRARIIKLYLKGFAISTLSRYFHLHNSSIRFHLIKAGVYQRGKIPEFTTRTIRKGIGAILLKTNDVSSGDLTYLDINKKDFWPPHEKNFPKSYLDYIKVYNNQHGTTYNPANSRKFYNAI